MPDLPSSPRKAVSSTSTAARSQTQKKPGAPKPKGAVRAKSGCYTCRIRRKKCDEQPNAEGACQTCVRLRLQCLGFGAKRPDWMRENNSVTELREKIKTFLASQGMIKGHSGSGPRSTEGDPPVLVLVENLHNHPSSPATPTLSQSSNDYRPQGPLPPTIRDGPHYVHPIPPPHDQHYPSPAPPSWHSHVPELNHHDPSRGSQLPTVPDMMYPNSTPLLPPSNSLLSINTSPSWPSNGTHYTQFPISSNISNANQPCQPQQFQHNFQPAPPLRSSFSTLYHSPPEPYSDEDTDCNSPPVYPVPFTIGGSELMRTQAMSIPPNELINHYLNNVFPIQYLMADKSVCKHMLDLINTSESARDAACMLAATHMVYMHEAHQSMVPVQFQRLQASLHLSPNKHVYTEGDAMAGLHVVSSYLFTGGRGSWPMYLDIASRFVQKTLDDTQRYGPEDVLKTCSEKTRFIIKTTFWFDVLASITTQKIPRFLRYYRLIFDPRQGFIEGDPEANEKLSMLPVMGCENHIVLAIAEISNLADWKEGQLRQKSLSYPELVKRGIKIEEDFLEPSYPRSNYSFANGAAPSSSSSASATNGYSLHDPGPSMTQGGIRAQQQPMNSDLEIEQRRRLTNDIFRAAARVYLHTVLSGDYPNCPEIREHVQTTIAHLQDIERFSHSVQRGVVRSVVFAICLCGCLTDDARQKGILLNLLRSQRRESVGNLSEVEKLIQNVWAARARNPSSPVNWREVMKQNQQDEATSLLLLV